MRVGDDHHVAGRIGIGVQDDKAMLGAMDDERLVVVSGLYGVAEDAGRCLLRCRDIRVAPGSPEIIHSLGQGSRCGLGRGTWAAAFSRNRSRSCALDSSLRS